MAAQVLSIDAFNEEEFEQRIDHIDVEEDRNEIYYRDGEGDLQSFEPRCYAYNYDFYVVIHVRNPYFDEIRFKLNDYKVDGKAERTDNIVDLTAAVRIELEY